jgi:hypothetical protein
MILISLLILFVLMKIALLCIIHLKTSTMKRQDNNETTCMGPKHMSMCVHGKQMKERMTHSLILMKLNLRIYNCPQHKEMNFVSFKTNSIWRLVS